MTKVFIVQKSEPSENVITSFSHLKPEDQVECSTCHQMLKPGSMRRHLEVHARRKPYGCLECSSFFTRKADVHRHIRMVHKKLKPHKCKECDRAFGDKKNLRWHIANHTKRLHYICEVCGFKFGKREYWESHTKYLHPVKIVPVETLSEKKTTNVTDAIVPSEQTLDLVTSTVPDIKKVLVDSDLMPAPNFLGNVVDAVVIQLDGEFSNLLQSLPLSDVNNVSNNLLSYDGESSEKCQSQIQGNDSATWQQLKLGTESHEHRSLGVQYVISEEVVQLTADSSSHTVQYLYDGSNAVHPGVLIGCEDICVGGVENFEYIFNSLPVPPNDVTVTVNA